MARRQTYPTFVERLRLCFHRSGMSEMDMNEDEIARLTAVSFGLLTWATLCLIIINILEAT
jgi:hypothetical protein